MGLIVKFVLIMSVPCKTILPPRSMSSFVATSTYQHTLLTHGINLTNVVEIFMVDKVAKIEITPGRESNINKNLYTNYSYAFFFICSQQINAIKRQTRHREK